MARVNPGDDRKKALEAAISQIDKNFGEGSASIMSSRKAVKIDSHPTGSLQLDIALGVGGLPAGRIVEIYGPESSGKTSLSLSVAGNVQRRGGYVGFVDAEHALDPEWAGRLGVDPDKLVIAQPNSGEEGMSITETMVQSGAFDLIIVDSVAAMVPKKELEGEMGDSHVGLQARLMSQALRKLTGLANNNQTTIIFINQLREKIGVFFGSPETTTGGKALKFYASVRLDIRRIETLKQGDTAIGNKVRVKVIKNKVAAPYKQAEPELMLGVDGMKAGFSLEGDIIDLGIANKLIKKSGAWFSDIETGNQLGQGKEKVRALLTEDTELRDKYETQLREMLLPSATVAEPKEAEEE